MSQKSYNAVAATAVVEKKEEKIGLYLSLKDGSVKYERFGEVETFEVDPEEEIEAEKMELEREMNMAIERIEQRRQQYKREEIKEYGYDKYTADFEYELESEEEP